MKKFFLGLMAILGMAMCFSACDKNKDNEGKSDATASGESLYEAVTDYQAADANTTEGKVAKLAAAAKLYDSYEKFKTNKEDKEWVKDFASGAVATIAETKKEEAKEKVIEKLTDGTLVSEAASDKIVAVAGLASELSKIFGGAK